MSDYEFSVDVDISDDIDTTAFAMDLSPLGGNGGDIDGDAECEYEYVDDDQPDDVSVNSSVEINVSVDNKKKHIKKPKKKTTTQSDHVADPAAKLPMATRAPRATPTGVIQTRAWSTGLCDCCNYCVPNCFMATFCPCISAAQIASRVGYKFQSVLIVLGFLVALEYVAYGLMLATIQRTEDGYNYSYVRGRYVVVKYEMTTRRVSFWGYIAYVLSIVLFVAYWQLRTQVRMAFALPGSCVGDCFVSFCCSCCALAQMATHVKSYKPHHCDFGAPDELPAYAE